jgi:hypothetical protein
MLRILEKATNKFVDEEYEICDLYVGVDGRVYKFLARCRNGIPVLEVMDMSDKFTVYIMGIDWAINEEKEF